MHLLNQGKALETLVGEIDTLIIIMEIFIQLLEMERPKKKKEYMENSTNKYIHKLELVSIYRTLHQKTEYVYISYSHRIFASI